MSRRALLKTVGGAAALGAVGRSLFAGPAQAGTFDAKAVHDFLASSLTQINPRFMVKPHTVEEWAYFKSSGGPTYGGSPGWIKYTDFLLSKMPEFGITDIDIVEIPYDRYVVDDWPDPKTHYYSSGGAVEKLVSDGTPVPVVASYGMTSGSTGPDGITAQMLYYDFSNPPSNAEIAGKILVFPTPSYPAPPYTDEFMDSYVATDYEFRSTGNWWPLFQTVPPSQGTSFHSRWCFSALNADAAIGIAGHAAGMVIVYDLSPDAAFGLTQRSVYTATGKAPAATNPPGKDYVNCPTLCLDRVNGAKVLQDAQAGKTATLTLIAQFERAYSKVFMGYLPGKYYGTPQDEQILLATHTDAMSEIEEDGGLGMLSIADYFNHIKQPERPRTLIFYFDGRHFMPGGENAWPQYDPFTIDPAKLEPVVACMGMEHMGGRQTVEVGLGGNDYEYSKNSPSDGGVITSLIDIYNNNIWFIEQIGTAAVTNSWPRVMATAGGTEPGVNGEFQMTVKSPMNKGRVYGLPGIGLAGDWPGAWTQTFSQFNTEAGPVGFDTEYFLQQVAGLCQLTGEMMLVKPIVLDLDWGNIKVTVIELPPAAFANPGSANSHIQWLVDQYVAAYGNVQHGRYKLAVRQLEAMASRVTNWVVEASRQPLLGLIEGQIAKLQDPNYKITARPPTVLPYAAH